jgi:hypothetical protein
MKQFYITMFFSNTVVLGLLGIVPALLPPGVAQGAPEQTITLDVALDCRTFNYDRGVPLDQIVRATASSPPPRYFLPAPFLPDLRATIQMLLAVSAPL